MNPYRGIYYIEGMVLFPTQIVVTRELNKASHIWLRALSDRMKKQNMRTVDTLREFGHKDLEIKRAIMQRYVLSTEEAEEYL